MILFGSNPEPTRAPQAPAPAQSPVVIGGGDGDPYLRAKHEHAHRIGLIAADERSRAGSRANRTASVLRKLRTLVAQLRAARTEAAAALLDGEAALVELKGELPALEEKAATARAAAATAEKAARAARKQELDDPRASGLVVAARIALGRADAEHELAEAQLAAQARRIAAQSAAQTELRDELDALGVAGGGNE